MLVQRVRPAVANRVPSDGAERMKTGSHPSLSGAPRSVPSPTGAHLLSGGDRGSRWCVTGVARDGVPECVAVERED